MAVSRADRRRERTARAVAIFGVDQATAALDLLELTELAWHDVYGEITPPRDVIDDILDLSEGSLAQLIDSALLAVTDRRDLKLAATNLRDGRG